MNIPDDDCFVVTMTVEQARAIFDGDDQLDKITEAIDEAQSPVFSGHKKRTYVVIEIEAD